MPPGRRYCPISATGALSACQIPERSGLPLRRGARADRFGLPSGVRGIIGSRYTAHGALTYRGTANNAVIKNALRFFKRVLPEHQMEFGESTITPVAVTS